MRLRRGAVLLGVVALAMTACGGDDDTAEPADDTPATDAPDATPSTDAPEPSDGDDTDTTDAPPATDAPQTTDEASGDGGPAADADAVMRYQWGTPGGSNYDPHVAFNQFANIFLYPAYDRLTELTQDGEVVPMLAESWEFTEGDTVLRMVLREGVTFHDGEPFDAEAVKANIERGQTLETSAVKADLASVDEVVVVDDLTVELRLAGPGAALPALLADRAGMMISPAAFDNTDLDLMPVGAGAFQVVEHTPGSVITFERFADYWDPDAQTLAGLELSMQLDPEARLRALQDGQIDGTGINPDQIGDAEAAGFEVQTRPTTGAFMLFLNKTKPGLDDPLVREAISLAIDRQGIADALHNGECTPSSQVFPTSYWAGNPDVEADPYDPDRARELLAEAGQEGLSMSAVVVNVPFYVAQLEALQAMLGEVGIQLEVTPLEPTELLSRFAGGDADMYFTQYPGSVDPAKTYASIFAAESSLNPGGYTNPAMEELAAQGLGTTDQAARESIYQELSAEAAADRFHVVVCNPNAVYVANDRVENLIPTLGGSFDFRGVTLSGS